MKPSEKKSERRARILNNEYNKKYLKLRKKDLQLMAEGKQPMHFKYLQVIMDPDDIGVWWMLIRGLDGVYKNGEYIVKMVASDDHPRGPPKYYFQTPNGLYALNANACINIGSYHASNYPQVLKMMGFASNLIGAMLQWKTLGSGISLVKTTEEIKVKLAAKSRMYNHTQASEETKKIAKLFDEMDEREKKQIKEIAEKLTKEKEEEK